MHRSAFVVLVSLAATPALAQGAAPAAYDRAPWWMDKPIIASTGRVWTEAMPNRARMSASYEAVDRESADAQRAAVDKVRALAQALAAHGAEAVRIETTFQINPLYAQYRDRQGEVNQNERADKIERYQVVANVAVEVRDIRLVERVYATLMAANPSSTRPVSFRLEPDNEALTQMWRQAVEDARRRAVLATEAAGARLGPVRLIDPTGRACETDVLVAGAPRYGEEVDAYRVPPPSAPSSIPPLPVPPVQGRVAGVRPDAVQLPLQPPLQRLDSRACVVFGLG